MEGTTPKQVSVPSVRVPVSAHICVNLEGALPTFLLFKNKKEGSRPVLRPATNGQCFVAYNTKSATQTSASMLYWVKHVFVPSTEHLRANGEWVMLILDNHASHNLPYPKIRKLLSKRIVLHYLKAHMTPYMMPLDVSVNGPLKQMFRKEKKRAYDVTVDVADQILDLMAGPISSATAADTVRKGFLKTGFISALDGLDDVPVPTSDLVVNELRNLHDLRKLLLKEVSVLPRDALPLDRQQTLETRLAAIKTKQLRMLYEQTYLKGKTSIPVLKERAGSTIDAVFVDDIDRIDKFIKADIAQEKARKEEEKKQKALEQEEKKKKASEEKEKSRMETNKRVLGWKRKFEDMRIDRNAWKKKCQKSEKEVERLKMEMKKLKKDVEKPTKAHKRTPASRAGSNAE